MGSLDGSDTEHSNVLRQNPKRYGSYIVRAPPQARPVSNPVSPRPSTARHVQVKRTASIAKENKKRFATLNPLVDTSLQRSLSQQDRLSSIVTPTKAKARPNPSSPPPENRHRRSLSRFTKELERYCVAASANSKAPLLPSTPTVSESPTTLGTVTELLPYHRQFRAAGLAVTSREQVPRISSSIPARGDIRDANVAATQVDGSTVSRSEKDSVSQEPSAPAVPDKVEEGRPSSQPKAQASYSDATPMAMSFLPWSPRKPPPPASRTHGDRRFSKDHIHPSLPTPAEPYLTPGYKLGRLDSYFDTPKPEKSEDEQPATRNTSTSSHISSTKSFSVDKPLPEQPPFPRHPVPARNERRRMKNTADWPTAGVLIHDNSPPPPSRDGPMTIFSPAVPGKESSSVRPWTTEVNPVQEPQRSPPSPPRDESGTSYPVAQKRPEAPPKDRPGKDPESQPGRRQHPEHLLCNNSYTATGLRRRPTSKPLPMPTTIREESEATEEAEKPPSDQADAIPEADQAPQLSVTLPESSSSFEQALDAVISKLDAMEERRQYERKSELQAARIPPPISDYAQDSRSRVTGSKISSAPRSERRASTAAQESGSASSVAVENSDRGIDDRDILLGLKMAICAACDEDLDAWIRDKTGLRLRRFLADLKAFDTVSSDRKPSSAQPLSRRIRRNGKENRRVQAEGERRTGQTSRWTPCFGGDGQSHIPESNRET